MAKSILITGAARGIGLCCALGLKKRGYTVFATARTAEDLQQLKTLGLEPIALELASTESIREAVAILLQATGGTLDYLFNNAGYGQPGAVEDLTRDAIRKQFEANVFGVIELTNLLIPVMRQQGHGRIIFTSSVLGLVCLPFRGAYNASKYALEAFADTLRLELAASSIQVSLLEPGPIASNFRAASLVAYRTSIQPAASHFAKTYQQLENYYDEPAATQPSYAQSPELVLTKLIKALENKRPKPRYFVTNATVMLATAKRLLPTRWLDKILLKIQKSSEQG